MHKAKNITFGDIYDEEGAAGIIEIMILTENQKLSFFSKRLSESFEKKPFSASIE